LRAGILLSRFEYWIQNRDFRQVYDRVRRTPVLQEGVAPNSSPDKICRAVDHVCIWYWKPVLCLQRSATTCCLLKMYGVPATLVIGVRQLPFRAHSWVELNGAIVNDKPYLRSMYAVVDEV